MCDYRIQGPANFQWNCCVWGPLLIIKYQNQFFFWKDFLVYYYYNDSEDAKLRTFQHGIYILYIILYNHNSDQIILLYTFTGSLWQFHLVWLVFQMKFYWCQEPLPATNSRKSLNLLLCHEGATLLHLKSHASWWMTLEVSSEK